MKIRFLVAFALFLILTSACKKKMDFPDKSLEKLIGEWEWVSATGGFAGTTETPATLGFTESLLFQNSGEYIHYRDSVEYRQYYFWVEEGSSIFSTETAYLLKLGNRDHTEVNFTYSIEFDGNDKLLLNEECNDCYQYLYHRKP